MWKQEWRESGVTGRSGLLLGDWRRTLCLSVVHCKNGSHSLTLSASQFFQMYLCGSLHQGVECISLLLEYELLVTCLGQQKAAEVMTSLCERKSRSWKP